MKLGLGRVIKARAMTEAAHADLKLDPALRGRASQLGRVVQKELLDAHDHAERLLATATERAALIVSDAERAAAELRLCAEAEGRAEASAAIAARALRLAHNELSADERGLDRSVELARLLAERLLGESLRVAPEQIRSLARQALSEARGARRIKLVAHPEDAHILEQSLATMGLDPSTTQVRADPHRGRGSLRIETEIGVLDAELAPQLERLALKLRESLSHDR
jgi:flagellar biosynthesis/type III secretory pathway protein FliH